MQAMRETTRSTIHRFTGQLNGHPPSLTACGLEKFFQNSLKGNFHGKRIVTVEKENVLLCT